MRMYSSYQASDAVPPPPPPPLRARPFRSRWAAALGVLLGAGCLACGKEDVSWSDPVPLDVVVPTTEVRLVMDDNGRPRVVPDSASNRAPTDPGLCPGSFRVASLGGKDAG